jgi:hypothetical protein
LVLLENVVLFDFLRYEKSYDGTSSSNSKLPVVLSPEKNLKYFMDLKHIKCGIKAGNWQQATFLIGGDHGCISVETFNSY